MTEPNLDPQEQRRLLSALADGDVDAAGARRACALWADAAEARETWHSYQLIGDVLRSDELAGPSAHDAAFLAALRLRLANEPVPLAAAPAVGAPAPQRPWRAVAAVAAGFVAVGGVALGLRGSPNGGVAASAQVAVAPTAASAVALVDPPTLVANGRLIRDAQLDRYLRAHREMTVGQPAALPGGALRSVETVVLER